MITKDAVWFITGCSRGLGAALAAAALKAGYRVVATARRVEDLAELSKTYGEEVLTLGLDVTDLVQVGQAVAQATAHFGSLDVLVNNAGYGLLGAIEEGSVEEMNALFATDLFAPVALIKAVLPGMRARKSGHIVNVSSIGGVVCYAGVGYYNMVKAGMEALSDALAKEVAPLGIGVTVVAPGAFRTDFRSPESIRQAAMVIEDYAPTAGAVRSRTLGGHGKQHGDPARAARAILQAVAAEHPPLHLLLGNDAFDQAQAKLDGLKQEYDAWESVARGTDFAGG